MPLRNPYQLLLVKQLYEDAKLLSDREDPLSLSKAVILLDLAVEQLLNHIVLTLDPDLTVNAMKAGRDVERKTVWGNAASCLNKRNGTGLTESREISNLHVLRNLVQHTGTDPARTEVKRYLGAAGAMIGRAFRDAYGLDFEAFRVWDFVPNESLRRWLQHHEDKLTGGDPIRCIVGCMHAYEMIIHTVGKKTRGHTHRRRAGDKVKRFSSATYSDYATPQAFEAVREEFKALQDEVGKQLDTLENEIVTLGVGMPVMDTRRFLRASDGIYYANFGGGRLEITIGTFIEQGVQTERAAYMLNYLSRLIRLVEEGHPGVLKDLQLALDEKNA